MFQYILAKAHEGPLGDTVRARMLESQSGRDLHQHCHLLLTQHLCSPPPLQPYNQRPLLGHLKVCPHDLTNGRIMTVLFAKCQGTQLRAEASYICSSLMLKSNPK